ncbi:MAG: NAD(P)H-dependent glycerol-3-phosphate dehydrogenase [Collinsella sp.]
MGDLIATCTSEHSRNRTFGYEFAHGVSLDEYQHARIWWSRAPSRPAASANSPAHWA